MRYLPTIFPLAGHNIVKITTDIRRLIENNVFKCPIIINHAVKNIFILKNNAPFCVSFSGPY